MGNCENGIQHTIQQGETASYLAWFYAVSVDVIKQAAGVIGDDDPPVGMTICFQQDRSQWASWEQIENSVVEDLVVGYSNGRYQIIFDNTFYELFPAELLDLQEQINITSTTDLSSYLAEFEPKPVVWTISDDFFPHSYIARSENDVWEYFIRNIWLGREAYYETNQTSFEAAITDGNWQAAYEDVADISFLPSSEIKHVQQDYEEDLRRRLIYYQSIWKTLYGSNIPPMFDNGGDFKKFLSLELSAFTFDQLISVAISIVPRFLGTREDIYTHTDPLLIESEIDMLIMLDTFRNPENRPDFEFSPNQATEDALRSLIEGDILREGDDLHFEELQDSFRSTTLEYLFIALTHLDALDPTISNWAAFQEAFSHVSNDEIAGLTLDAVSIVDDTEEFMNRDELENLWNRLDDDSNFNLSRSNFYGVFDNVPLVDMPSILSGAEMDSDLLLGDNPTAEEFLLTYYQGQFVDAIRQQVADWDAEGERQLLDQLEVQINHMEFLAQAIPIPAFQLMVKSVADVYRLIYQNSLDNWTAMEVLRLYVSDWEVDRVFMLDDIERYSQFGLPTVLEFVGGIVFEPLDWALIARDLLVYGELDSLAFAALLPVVSYGSVRAFRFVRNLPPNMIRRIRSFNDEAYDLAFANIRNVDSLSPEDILSHNLSEIINQTPYHRGITGATYHLDDYHPLVEEAYQRIANYGQKEIDAIAEFTNINREYIKIVHEHLFLTQHTIVQGEEAITALFSPHPDIAAIWEAALRGDWENVRMIDTDGSRLILDNPEIQFYRIIAHEYIEASVMRQYPDMPYRHPATWVADENGFGHPTPETFGAHDLAPNFTGKPFSHWAYLNLSPDEIPEFMDNLSNLHQVLEAILRIIS